jgi:hypothetical protein
MADDHNLTTMAVYIDDKDIFHVKKLKAQAKIKRSMTDAEYFGILLQEVD